MDFLTCDIRFLKGVGEKRALGLNRLGVYTVKDLLYLFPRRYIDYSAPVEVAFAPYDQPCVVKATVISCGGGIRINGGKTLFRVVCADDTARLNITFFNAEYTVKRLEVGKDYLFYGKFSGGMLVREVTSPTFISADSGVKQQPIYPLTAGISSAMLGKYVGLALEQIREIPDFMPEKILQEYQLCSLDFALRAIHSAKSCEDLIAAKSRLIFDEFFILQLGISLMGENERRKTQVIVPHTDLTPLLESLPFSPTGAQLRATQEIFADFAGGMGMNRLLQGDVGSGKTLVAVFTMYAMANSGYQSCLMAPTEILAAQHYTTVTNLLKGHNIRVALLTAGVKAKERREILDGLARGEIDILIGTHSVISDSVVFKNLGFCITDEQHRFGVLQRIAVSKKGDNPHILVMSATPIPRTLSMIIYGNMQLSILDELPMGRKPIETFLVGTDKRARMFGFISKQVAMGGQAYIVLPAIEDSENMSDLQSVTTYYEEIIKPLLPEISAEILHGKLKAKEKEEIMGRFAKGEVSLLCSTTVIEVGVDVPNACLIIIENAERYGLSALHQLRGRVGRGQRQSYCILVSDNRGENVRERLKFLCGTQDGFKISQYDLDSRGPGDFFGARQHGLPNLKIAQMSDDIKLLEQSQCAAAQLLNQDSKLENHPKLKQRVEQLFQGFVL